MNASFKIVLRISSKDGKIYIDPIYKETYPVETGGIRVLSV